MSRSELLPDDALSHMASLVAAVDAAESADLPWRGSARIHFLRNFTIEGIEPYLRFHLLRDDMRPVISFGGYDTMLQEVLDPGSAIRSQQPDVIVLSLLIEFLDSAVSERNWDADGALQRFDELVGQVLDTMSGVVVANALLPPIDCLISGSVPHGLASQLNRLNEHLNDVANRHPGRFLLSDWPALVGRIGNSDALDQRFWKSAQAPFTRHMLDAFARQIAERAAKRGAVAKKCVILDCDNTLWGGVVGEDQIDGIALGPGSGPGRPYYELQQSVLALYERGVMLALCSKNNEDDVWQVLESHSHCLVKKSHLVAWRINWTNKAENIVSLCRELNIGADSMVFVDDSPQECDLVRAHLPEVTVLQVPDDLADNPRFLIDSGLFDSKTLSAEDLKRTELYQQEAQRREVRNRALDLDAYLQSLETEVHVKVASDAEVPRVAQLTQKTNQFNLTTRRYSEDDIRTLIADERAAVFTMSAADRYGDMGLTGVLIAAINDGLARVDTFLLSCRVLGRQLEYAFLDQCLRRLAETWSPSSWSAEYRPTRKNAQVADFWEHAGFELASTTSGAKRYVATAVSPPQNYLELMKVYME